MACSPRSPSDRPNRMREHAKAAVVQAVQTLYSGQNVVLGNDEIDRCRETFRRMFPHTNDPFLDTRSEASDGAYEEFSDAVRRLELYRGQKVLYVGTGSGFGTYVVSQLVGNEGEVRSYERESYAHQRARERLENLNLRNVVLHPEDVFGARIERSYFDRVLIAAGAPLADSSRNMKIGEERKVLQSDATRFFLRRIKSGGKILIPMGELHCGWMPTCTGGLHLVRRKSSGTFIEKISEDSYWAPLVGEYGFSKSDLEEVVRKEGTFADELL